MGISQVSEQFCRNPDNKGKLPVRYQQVKKDSLEFYITTRSKQKVQIALPENWENNWHFVTATYDGGSIYIDVDGRVSDKKAVSGNIRNTPFPVNIGRNAEIHGQETTVYICDAIIDQVGIFAGDHPNRNPEITFT